jgi:hypothetical protein
MGWGGFYPWAGGIGVPAAFQLGVQSEISKFLADPNATYNYVLEGTVYRSASEDVGFPDAWGAFPWGFGGSSIDNGIYYAWDTLNTESTDTPPNKHMPGLLTVPINYEVSAPITGTGGGASSGFGGRLRVGGTYGVGSGAATLDYADWFDAFTFRARDIEYNEDNARLLITDALADLAHDIQTNLYLGDDSTYEGDVSLKGLPKPLTFGRTFNCTPVLVNSTSRIYQIHDGAVSDIVDVRDNGLILTDAGDTTDLPGWTGGSAGQYKTDISRGLIRLWSVPNGAVTCNPLRANTDAEGAVLDVLEKAGITNIQPGTFGQLPNVTIGFFLGAEPTHTIEVLNQILFDLDAWVYGDRNGKVACGVHGNPLFDPPIAEIEGRAEADSPCVVVSLSRIETPSPPSSVQIAYKRNYTPLSDQSLDSSLTLSSRQAFGLPFLVNDSVSNADALDVHPDAEPLILGTGIMRFEAGADIVRDQIINRLGKRRNMYEITITYPLFRFVPGQIVKVFYDRFGLAGGVNGEIVSVIDQRDTTTIRWMTVQ